MKAYKYYLRERPLSPGALPKDFVGYVGSDTVGGRYGAVYYERKLTAKEIKDYELGVSFEVLEDTIESVKARVSAGEKVLVRVLTYREVENAYGQSMKELVTDGIINPDMAEHFGKVVQLTGWVQDKDMAYTDFEVEHDFVHLQDALFAWEEVE
ncbi:hypothetical protein SELR_18000 [Selenomonas ruminantium subsp. lactilytica TAM6421]|uniref:Defence against restriction A C-terminal domain-containing protein n=1 Tax=Selenomonas ruminantium subsp. lactilytica (strain NBRC 103574 / TAM6421) TaxID=927704 RepID=I0GRX1_SELRL|nr:hypothetical protein [Selenomonas ruminantium]BAL83508.1 hypothetical protein SELR_18000 [Selenomonas ruminantium subsp. lactilytica TAM6421]